jgi:serine/threonine-protein kinase
LSELDVEVGQVIAGKYRLVKLLGRGGMGSVWRAWHLTLSSDVAVKIIKPEIARDNENAVLRFLREAKAAAMLRSPHVVQVLDHGKDGELAFIAMELLDGESLQQRLKRCKKLEPGLCATVMTHVGRAIGKAHESGIVHRDLKPDNIFLVENEDEILAKVLDFGIAKSTLMDLNQTDSPSTQTGALLGTPYYMSPEQATGQKDIDARSDLWALGVIAYECLVGKRPYRSDNLGDLVLQICARPLPIPSQHGDVPPGFDAWFAKAQERDPDERFQSAKEMVAALREVLARPLITREEAPSTAVAPMAALEPGATLCDGHPSPSEPSWSAAPRRGAIASVTLPSRMGGSQPGVASATSEDGSSRSLSSPVDSGQRISAAASAEVIEDTVESAGLKTLDPLASTTAPRNRKILVRSASIALGLALLTVPIYWLTRTTPTARESAGSLPSASQAAIAATAATSASVSTPTTAVLEASAAPASSVAASAKSSDAPARGPRPSAPASARPVSPPVATIPPPAPPPQPPPDDDPLGIGKPKPHAGTKR